MEVDIGFAPFDSGSVSGKPTLRPREPPGESGPTITSEWATTRPEEAGRRTAKQYLTSQGRRS
jgi:hypothetical protein